MIARIAATAVLGALLASAPASAKTFCVDAKPCKGTPVAGLNAALATAAKSDATDTIVLGPGTFSAPAFAYKGKSRVVIQGRGCSQSILTTTKPKDGGIVLNLNAGKRSAISGVGVKLPNGQNLTGMRLHHVDATKVCVTGGPAAGGAVGVRLRGSTLAQSQVFLPLTSSGPSEIRAVWIDDDQVSKVLRSTLQARTAALVQSDNSVLQGIDALVQRGVFVDGAKSVAVHSSLFRLRGDGSRFAVDVIDGTALANQITVYAFPQATNVPSVGFQARENSYLRVSNSIARDVDISFNRRGDNGEATINARYDDLDLSTAAQSGAGQITAKDVVNVDPQFVDVLGGGFKLKETSPLIDAGAPGTGLEMGESNFDLDERARIIDFDKKNGPRRDIGAFERQLFLIPGKD